MKTWKSSLWLLIEQVLPWFVLAILLLYTYAKFFAHPYGIRWSSSTGEIIYVFVKQPEPTLHEGDQITQIGDVTWEEYRSDLRKTFFAGAQPGDIVPIRALHSGKTINVSWIYPGFNWNEFLEQFYSEWGIAYVLWMAGLLTILLIRPKDDRWLLMALFNFLTAIWLIAGSGVSAFHIWGSALVLRIAVILSVPVYLHLHWVFPQPLGKLSSRIIGVLYTITLVLVIAQWFQILPSSFYILGFLVALVGSFILLIIHIWRQPLARRDLRLLFVTSLLAITLAIVWQIIYSLNKLPLWFGDVGLLGLPLIPLAYLYSAFRRRLGDLELRVNRFFSIYLFVILLGIVEIPLMVVFDQSIRVSGEGFAIGLISAIVTVAAFIWGYPAFENFVEHRIFGIPLPSKRVLETYSVRINTSVSSLDLVRVLQEEILPSLLIRQFAFLQTDQGSLNILSTMGLKEEQLPKEKDLPDLPTRSSVYRSPDPLTSDWPYSWIRLILPLKLGEHIIGFWLFGRRDPDDLYSQLEIPILQSLASQTAIALSNILQTGRLKAMYEANIDRYEQERLRLAHDLHDSILNEMAAMMINSDAPVFSAAFQKAFDELTERLREIVNDLRPPMLAFGLKLAFEDFVENLRERNQGGVEIVIDIQANGEWRYPEIVENNLYRIVQQACENSLRHAHAKRIMIFGELYHDKIDIKVDDDGIGFDSSTSLRLDDMLAKKHFGLVGIFERANLIGAVITINSELNQGTHMHVLWKSKEPI